MSTVAGSMACSAANLEEVSTAGRRPLTLRPCAITSRRRRRLIVIHSSMCSRWGRECERAAVEAVGRRRRALLGKRHEDGSKAVHNGDTRYQRR